MKTLSQVQHQDKTKHNRMTQNNQATTESNPVTLKTHMLIGAGIGLLAITFFLVTSGGGNPAWGKFWMIRPLIVVPFAGAMGGLCNYVLINFRQRFGINKAVAIVLSGIVAVVGLWMGIVLGLNGTMWN
jgi:hypothetical protein